MFLLFLSLFLDSGSLPFHSPSQLGQWGSGCLAGESYSSSIGTVSVLDWRDEDWWTWFREKEMSRKKFFIFCLFLLKMFGFSCWPGQLLTNAYSIERNLYHSSFHYGYFCFLIELFFSNFKKQSQRPSCILCTCFLELCFAFILTSWVWCLADIRAHVLLFNILNGQIVILQKIKCWAES